MLMTSRSRTLSRLALPCALTAGCLALFAALAADNSDAAAQKERELIRIISSDAPPQDKAVPCKQLAVYGTKEAVPALAALLPNSDLSSWARIALEAIPDPAAGEALRNALGQLRGRLLVGVINSIGFRRDPKAVGALAGKIKDSDFDTAAAAAAALGRIGGTEATAVLEQTLATADGPVRREAAWGCILCAEQLFAAGKRDAAVKLYDTVRQANVARQRVLEATRGAILARQAGGLPLLLEQLASPDKALFGIGLRTARELRGAEVTQALAEALARTAAERQPAMLALLADRADAAVLPVVSQAARRGPTPVRLAAINALEQLNLPASVGVLLDAATETDAAIAQKAKSALAKLSGKEIDADLAARLPKASGLLRQVLIELAGLRRIEAALPAVVALTADPDAGARAAAVATIGSVGTEREAGELVRLLQRAKTAGERDDLEKALLAICGRQHAACLPHLLPLARHDQAELRKVALHTLSSVGGPDALKAVRAVLEDKDEAVQDEAVRTLSTWSSTWPDDAGVAEPLLALAKSAKKMTHQVLGLRGYLQYVQGDAHLGDDEKVARLTDLLPVITRPEEKRLALPVISSIQTGKALELLLTCAAEPSIAEESYLAIVSLAAKTNLKGASKELREKALQTVLEKSGDDRTKKRADDALKKLKQ